MTQITVITKNRITSTVAFRLTQNFSYIRSSLCSRHLQSFKSVLQKLFHWRSKNVLQMSSPALQAHLARCRPRTRMVQWCHVWRWQPRQWGVLLQKMLFLEFTWPDNRKCASSENQTLSRKSGTASILSQNHWHMITRFLISSGVSLFNLYPVRIHVEICDQNYPHGLPVDSKLLTSPTHRLAWAVDNRVYDSSYVVWCPWWFRSSSVWLYVCLYDWGYAQSHGFWTCWPICRSLSGQEIHDIRTVLWIAIELRG